MTKTASIDGTWATVGIPGSEARSEPHHGLRVEGSERRSAGHGNERRSEPASPLDWKTRILYAGLSTLILAYLGALGLLALVAADWLIQHLVA